MSFRKNWSWEQKNWANLVNFNIWRVLKILRDHPCHIREIIKETKIAPNILEHWVIPCLLKFGLAEESWGMQHIGGKRRILSLTEDGKKVLAAFGLIGEVVERARGSCPFKQNPRGLGGSD